MLSLELSSKGSGNDETPTPTRLIRNCEEVGLFQDLQNVNPFDEVFKKAVENPSSVTLQVPASSSDDTLHTPQIYPNLDSTSEVFSLGNVISNIDRDIDDSENPLVIVLDSDKEEENILNENQKENVRDKVKTAILNKAKASISPIPICRLIEPKETTTTQITKEFVLRREANKAAQSRCRERKKIEFEYMKKELKQLRCENKQLLRMNKELHGIIEYYKKQIKDHRLPDSLLEIPSNYQGVDIPTFGKDNEDRLRTNNQNWSNKVNSTLVHSSREIIRPINSITTLPIPNVPSSNMIIIVNGVAPSTSLGLAAEESFSGHCSKKCKNNFKTIVPK